MRRRWPLRAMAVLVANAAVLALLLELAGLALYTARTGGWFYGAATAGPPSDVPPHYRVKQVIFHPYFGYVNHPEREDDPLFGVNNHGFQVHRSLLAANPRCCDYPYEAAANEVVVGVFGGSVGVGFSGAAQSSPLFSRLVAGIPRFQGKSIRVLDFSLSGFRQPQQLMVLAYYLSLGMHFDLVINIDGFNETVNSVMNWKDRLEPTFPPDAIWGAMGRALEAGRVPGGDGDDFLALYHERAARSARIAGNACMLAACYLLQTTREQWHNWRSRQALVSARSRTEEFSWFPMTRRRTFSDDIDLAEFTADRWRDSSILMRRLLDRTDTIYLHVLQPNQWYRPGFDYVPKRLDHIYGWVIEPVNRFYPAFLRRADQLARAGVDFLDATAVFRGQDRDAIFADDCCHYTEHGYEFVFAAIAEKLKSLAGDR